MVIDIDDNGFGSSPTNEVTKLIELVTSDPIVMASVQWRVREGHKSGSLINIHNDVVGAWRILDD